MRSNEMSKLLSTLLAEMSSAWNKEHGATIANNIANTIEELSHGLINVRTSFDTTACQTCEIMLENGFYPYGEMPIGVCHIRNIADRQKVVKAISKYIEESIIYHKEYIIKGFPKHSTIIEQIYDLYENKEYRLCILSQINLLNIVFNETFDAIDFAEKKELPEKLKELKILPDKEKYYAQFSPYMKIEKNAILYNGRKERYENHLYCRNAIVHGYSDNFGNKENCLRYFSVILNTIGLLKICQKITMN